MAVEEAVWEVIDIQVGAAGAGVVPVRQLQVRVVQGGQPMNIQLLLLFLVTYVTSLYQTLRFLGLDQTMNHLCKTNR